MEYLIRQDHKKLGYRILFFFVFSLIGKLATAQVNDAGCWQNIYLEKKISRQWDLHFNYESRINENITRFHYAYGDFGISYKVNKHIHLMADYVFVEKKSLDDLWYMSHQGYVAVTLKQKIGAFSFSDRIMPQIQYSKVYSDQYGMVPDIRLRNKTMIKYNNNSLFTYYIACELSYKLNEYYKVKKPAGPQFDRVRYFAGFFYELNKVNSVELYYLIEQYFNVENPTTNYVIGVGYAHTFY